MYTCDHYRELIWDREYDLLEGAETEGLDAHLEGCGTCQAEAARAQQGRQQIASVACLDVEVPEFVPPLVAEPVTATAVCRPAARPLSWNVVFAAAAGLLLLVGVPFGLHLQGRWQHETNVASAQQLVAQVQRQWADVRNQQMQLVKNDRNLRLEVVGPASYDARLDHPYRIRTSNLAGEPRPTRVSFRLLGEGGQEYFSATEQPTEGTLVVTVPAGLALPHGKSLKLHVVAANGSERWEGAGVVRVSAPTYLTHLTLDKSHYQPGERVFYRSLTLDAFSHQPGPEPFKVVYTAYDQRGQLVHRQAGQTREGGIGGGDFIIPTNLTLDGEVTLTVKEANERFPAMTRTFLVIPTKSDPSGLTKTVQLEKATYRPGEMLRILVQAQRDGKPVGKAALNARLEVDGQPAGTVGGRTGEDGKAVLQMPLPRQVETGLARIEVTIDNIGRPEKIARTLTIDVPRVQIDFFPEGGELLADVPNRVYFRARSPLGREVAVQGRVVDEQNRDVATARTAEGSADLTTGVGVFELTPKAGQHYRLLVATPAEVAPVTLPEVREKGIALRLPYDDDQGMSFPVVVHQSGLGERHVVVAAVCRGRVVAHTALQARTGANPVEVQLLKPVHGVVRVTLYDAETPQLIPVAERLIFRDPVAKLNLGVKPHKERYRPGERVQLKVEGRTENGESEQTWLHVAVLDQKARERLDDPRHRPARSHFHVLSELREPHDLEWSDVLLQDEPQARSALDLYLATQGWRRFRVGGDATPKVAVEPDLVKVDTFDAAQQQFQQLFGGQFNQLVQTEQELRNEERQHVAAYGAAAAAKLSHEQGTARLIQRVLSSVVAAALLVGLVYLVSHLFALRFELRRGLTLTGAALVLCIAGLYLSQGEINLVIDPSDLPKTLNDNGMLALDRKPLPAGHQSTANFSAPRLQIQEDGTLLALKRPNGKDVLIVDPKGSDTTDKPLPVREYAHGRSRFNGAVETIYWHPFLIAADGTAQVEFDLPREGQRYQIQIQGHTPSGRMGALQSNIEATP